MTEPDERRLGEFMGAIVLLAAVFLVASRIADVSTVALAPVCMFTPLTAGFVSVSVTAFPSRTSGCAWVGPSG